MTSLHLVDGSPILSQGTNLMLKYTIKKEILSLITKSKKNLYYSDISETLNISIQVVVNICKELIKEGKVEIKDK